MITIENIKRIEKTYWNFDSKTIQCIKAEEVNDDLILNRNSYTFDFDIGLGDVPLVIWLDRHKDNEQNGYRFENNLSIGYAYDSSINNFSTVSGGIHTFYMNFRIDELLSNRYGFGTF